MANAGAATQEFLDTHQYSNKSILRYERIFGHTWVSTGGETTTKDFLIQLDLKPGMKILDIGCGTGGSAFFMARQYGCYVHAMDLSANMIHIADDRLKREDAEVKTKVSFEIADCTTVNYPHNEYDLIYSRDTILHIKDKEGLYKRMLAWLKPGGTLFVSDYCRGDQEHSQEFMKYKAARGYDLRTVAEYGKVIENAGYRMVRALDHTQTFINVLTNELKYFEPTKEAFIKDFSEKDYTDISDGWRVKLVRCKAGDQAWGIFFARK